MKLTGIKTQEVDVEITPQEMIRGLYHEDYIMSVV